MTSNDFNELKTLLSEPKRIAITTHRSPDGDAIGSSLGLYHFLKQADHSISVIVPDPYPDFLHWMPGQEAITIYDHAPSEARDLLAQAEIVFSLDYNATYRTGNVKEAIDNATGIKVLIDHHEQPEDFAQYMLSRTSASSTAELIYDFIEGLGQKDRINAEVGQCLYAGIVTDTGSFRFPSSSAHTHRIAAELIDAGLEHALVHQKIYDTNSQNRLRLLGYSLSEKLVVNEELRTAYISLNAEELARFHFRKGDTEGLVNYALSVNNVVFAALIMQKEQAIRLSLRSKGNFDVNRFARAHFSGGGHKHAAGGSSDHDFEGTIAHFNSILPQYADDLKNA